MKKAIAILVLAALLSGCAQTAEPVQTTATTSTSTIITEREERQSVTNKATGRAVSTTPSATEPTATTTTTARATTTTAPVSATTATVSATETASRTTARATTTEPVSAQQQPVSTTTTTRLTTQTERPTTRATTTTKAVTTAMPRTTTTTTAKPAVTTTTKITVPKPPIISKATTTAIIDGITYVEVPDVTCLATMIENLEETDTTPYYYIQIGKKLKHDGTDYGKAVAVFNWVTKNGWGSCVYHALETYYVCQGIGLECAYAFMTDYGWYGHTFNVVKVNGEWYALDTQAGIFLDNWPYVCKRMFNGNDRDPPPFDEDVFYPYDEDGKYRDWKIEIVE